MDELFQDGLEIGTKDDRDYRYDLGWQRSKGFKIDMKPNTSHRVTWSPDAESAITGMQIRVSGKTENFHDKMDILFDNVKLVDDVTPHDKGSFKNYRNHLKILEENVLSFIYYNYDNEPKTVWWDIDYLAEPLLTLVRVVCIDDNTGVELKRDVHLLSPGEHLFYAPKINGYYLLGDFKQTVYTDKTTVERSFTVTFRYINKLV